VSAVEAPARPLPGVRDPLADHLLTPQNSAFIIIDYQPRQVAGVRSMDADLLIRNAVSAVKLAQLFGLPIVHSTVNVASGNNKPTIEQLAPLLDGFEPIDRTTINAWEDGRFLAAVRATGKRKLVMCALWTEMCLAFPTLDALREGYEVYPVVDAVGGTSGEAHRAAVDRVVQAGAQPITWASLAGELQRDWARVETVSQLIELAINERPINERL
jgi:nicotinamidase-related amidase